MGNASGGEEPVDVRAGEPGAEPPDAEPPDGAPLFCPFCGECFEGERRCPSHDLPLVPFDALAAMQTKPVPDEHEPVPPYDPRFGRGWIAAGALLVLVGFLLPFATSTQGARVATATGLQVASRAALNLWLLPMAAVTWTAILARRRTLAEMRGARLAIPLLCLGAAASLGYSLWRIHEGAARIGRAYGVDVDIDVRAGAWVMGVGVVLALVGGLRFGAPPKRPPPRYPTD